MRRFVLSISSIAAAVTLAVGAYAQQPTTPNRGTGKFAPGKALAAAGVRGVTAADLDGDGVAEIVTVGLQGLAVHRREAGNDGGYRATVRLARPDLRAVAAADFDGDGKVDVAVASEAGIELLRGASGSAPEAVIQMGAAELAAQDLNGDGLADLIALGEDGGPVTVLAGSAVAGLRVADEIRGATPAAGYVAADFDRDGIADLALARRGEPAIHLYRGSAELRFSDAGTVAVDGAVTALDVHHDSAGAVGPDLVIRTAGREDVRLLPGNGDLSFRAPVAAGRLALEMAPPLAVDLDNNGAVDRVVRAASAVTVLPQAGASHGISKTHTGTFTRGGTGEYKIVVNGPAPGLTFEVSDTLPAGVTLIEDLGFGFPWECMVDGAEIRCFGSHLQPDVNGDFAPILLPVAIAANAPAVISNTATVTDATGTASATDTVTLGGGAAAPDLTIGKTHTGNFPAGGTGVFTLLVTNVGSAATTAPTVVNDTPQAGLAVVSMGGTGWVCDVPARRCTNNATLGPGASFPPITVAVTVSANAPDPAQNNATVSGGGDTNAANNNAVDTVTVTRPDLRMGKQHAGNFRAGQTSAVYSLTVTNVGNGASTAAEVAVVDTLPAPLAAQSMAGAGWSCTLATLRCTRSEVLAPGAAYPPITLTVDVPANAPTLLTNRADLSGGGDTNAANNQALDPTTIEKADLTISKTHAGNFAPGARASYTITVTNVGAAASAGTVTVLENVPAALTGPAISGAGWTCVTTPQVSCSRADALAAGASYPPIVFEATVAPTAAASFTNTVTVSGGGDANGGNNTAIDNTSSGVADLTIAKTHVGNFYLGQNNATWTITVSNAGNGDTAGEVRVNEFPQSGGLGVPATFLVNSISGSGWTCVGGAAPACTRTDVLAAGASYPPITVQGLIPGNATGTQVGNRATVEGGGETNTANNEARDSALIERPDLTVAKTHTGNFYLGQTDATWTITVSNVGAGRTAGEVRVDERDNGVQPLTYTVQAVSGPGWTCVVGAATYCTRFDVLAAGASYPPITVQVAVSPVAPTSQASNGATVQGGGETNTANNSADDSALIERPDVRITKTHVGNFRQGQANAVYTLTVSNVGNRTTRGEVEVTELPPTPTPFTSFTMAGTGWTCAGAVCSRTDALAAGASYPAITVTAVISGTAAANFTNRASVTAAGDLVSGNNTASDPTTVTVADPDLTIAKTHVGNFYLGQNDATWTITVSNVGNGDTVGEVRVNEFPQSGGLGVPATYLVNSISGSGWTCVGGATPSCTRSDVLAAGASYPAITVRGLIPGNATGTHVGNRATVEGGGETNTANNEARDSALIERPDLTIAKTHTGNFYLGQTDATWTITVTNAGAGRTAGEVRVDERDNGMQPLTYTVQAVSGAGWTCVVGAATYCTRADVLAAGASYPPITVLVAIAPQAPTSQASNSATVQGGGETNTANNSADDSALIERPDVRITKMHVGNFRQGQANAVYTLTVSNLGNRTTRGEVEVTELPPTPSPFTSFTMAGTGWTCAGAVCSRTDALAAGASYPAITVTAVISGTAAANFTNRASVTAAGDLVPGNNTASDPTTTVADPDLTITKTHTGNFYLGQGDATWTITVSNVGNGDTVGEVRVNEFPQVGGVFGVPVIYTVQAISGAGWACVPGAAPYCTRTDTLAAGASYPPITMRVAITGNTTSTQAGNRATVTGGGETNTANNEAQDGALIDRADLTITKTHVGNFYLGQGDATWTITVTNAGAGRTVGEVRVNEFPQVGGAFGVPVIYAVQAISGAGWACVPGAAPYCTRTDALAAGASYPPITFRVAITGNTTSTHAGNRATVTGGGEANTANNEAEDGALIERPDLAITKTHTGIFRQGQANVAYTLTVTNAGARPTSGLVEVTELPPTPSPFASFTMAGAGWTCAGASCQRTDALAAGASYPPITVTATISATAVSFINQAQVTAPGDTNSANNTAADPTIVRVADADLTITKTHTGNFYLGQGDATWTITVSNVGNGDTVGEVRVNEFPQVGGAFGVPVIYTVQAISGAGWACVPGAAPYCTRTDALAAGASYPPITMRVAITGNTTSTQAGNRATVTGGGETNTANNEAVDGALIDRPDLTISKTHTGNFYLGQGDATWTITVTNAGAGRTVGEVRVNEFPQVGGAFGVPVIYTVQAISGAGWACVPGAAPYCTRTDALAAGASYPPITMRVAITGNTTSTHAGNRATVTGGGETNTANNEAEDGAFIERPDLTITKTHFGDFRQGQVNANYTLTVTNVGIRATTTQVQVTELPPSPSPFASFILFGSGWTCAGAVCTRSDALAPGASYPPITVRTMISSTATSFTNQARVEMMGDLTTANNTASDPTTVLPGVPDLRVNKTHTGTFVQGQVNGQYTISVTNVGTGATVGLVTVTDILPPVGLTGVAIGGPGWVCSVGAMSCSRADPLAAGANYQPITVTVNVAANAPAVVVNQATVAGGGDTNAVNNATADPTTVVASSVNVSAAFGAITLNRATGRMQQMVTLQNNGANLTSLALAFDALPAAVTLFAPDGVTAATAPAGSPYREWGPMPAGAVRAILLEFARTGAAVAPVTYNPRLIGPGPR